MKLNNKYLLILLGAALFASGCRPKDEQSIHYDRVVDLDGKWKFSIGDDMRWADSKYNDDNWEEIKVPSSWEDQGFNGLDGYAWYRIHFRYDDRIKSQDVYLNLGRVDDADQTYLNGHLLGFTGTFPPNIQTAYYVFRRYYIPPDYFNKNGDNVIAVRVYDIQLSGGILEGNPGIEIEDPGVAPDFNLAGIWKFKTGDDSLYSEINYRDSAWSKITVPQKWEVEGYPDYDGIAWYRKEFTLPDNLSDKSLFLLMGKIDDIDQTYLNGKLLGYTGYFNFEPPRYNGNDYLRVRAYKIPAGYLNTNGKNIIAVRVYDGFKDGGIYEGPVGIITNEKYSSFWREISSKNRF
ncbi:MAG TPA: beta galactosidase jelly roll domain-containing protein [Ignavibacteriaceae bacterium]|nr:beta galactosidase jelly roll domain-containing protein [Ignavibacteriaceae bacterium]